MADKIKPKKMIKYYIIAHEFQGSDLTVHTNVDSELALKHLAEITDQGFRQPMVDETPEDYYSYYLTWVREENDNQCDNTIVLEVIELELTFKTL